MIVDLKIECKKLTTAQMAKSGNFEVAASSAASANCNNMEIRSILKAQTDAAADSSKTCHFL